ncbi:TIGR01620 family protein [Shewanella sp. OPT22]|nr:TIGR01620 family protein [Shewanella sp. OPT22]
MNLIKKNEKTEKVQLKPAQEFNELEALLEPEEESLIKPPQKFETDDLSDSDFEALFDDVEQDSKLKKARPWSKLARWAVVSVFILVMVELGLTLLEAWQQSPFLFGLYSATIGLVGTWAGRGLFREYKKLKKLKDIESQRETAVRVEKSVQTGEVSKFIAGIKLPEAFDDSISTYNELTHSHLNDSELLKLYDETVMSVVDEKAKKIVHKYAAESALLLAVSPFAILDMCLVLLRNQKMLNELAQCYGIELGYMSRIKLIRGIFTNILFAGASELLTDLGSQLLSLEITGKLSAKLGQGLAGGLLTARLGYQAMELCRPIQFHKDNKPRLSKAHKSLLVELKNFAKSVKN